MCIITVHHHRPTSVITRCDARHPCAPSFVCSVACAGKTRQQYLNCLQSTAGNLDSSNPSKVGKLGSGVINPYKSLTQCGFTDEGPTPTPPIRNRPPPPPRRVASPPPPPPIRSSPPPPPPSPRGGGGGGSPFTLVPGESCGIEARGCVHSPGWPGGYGVSQSCNIGVAVGTKLRVESFSVEDGRRGNCVYDYLEIADQRYCGSSGPDGIVAGGGGRIRWKSDYSVNRPGWLICGESVATSPPDCDCPCAREGGGDLFSFINP